MFPDGVQAALRQAGIDAADDTLDIPTFEAMLAEFGPALLAEVAASFRAEAEGAFTALDAAIAASDAAAAERQYHFMKGSALYLALGRLARLCERLEAEAHRGLYHGSDIAAALRAEVARGLGVLAALGIARDG